MVVLDINHPIPSGFFGDDNKIPVWVSFKYEKQPNAFCYTCGRIGHGHNQCSFKASESLCAMVTRRELGLTLILPRPRNTEREQ
ncbi:hypothetical protein LINGRAHAP2_LOCUS29029 [Linum grandiflorum]